MAYVARLLLLSVIGALSSCQSESNQLRVGDLLYTPAVQHERVSAEVAKVDFVFEVSNRGTKPVNILGLDADCTCISETISQSVIPPGGASTITATYLTAGVTGIEQKTLQVKTDHPAAEGEAALEIKLEVEPIYQLSKKQLTWKVDQPTSSKAIDFIVTREKPIHVVSAIPSRPEFTASVKEIKAGRHYQIEVKPTTTAGFMVGFIRLQTDCEIESLARPLLYTSVKE